MAERLVELIRDLAKDSKDPRVVELLSLVGKDGDPHEITQRATRMDEDRQPHDTTRHAQVDSNGDIAYQPGDGFFISRLKLTDRAFNVKPKFRTWDGTKKGGEWSGQFIPENLILEMAKEIEAHRRMEAAAVGYREKLHQRLERNHEGTDAQKGSKSQVHEHDDDYDIDKSESYVFIGTTQGTDAWLNGSAVSHRRFVTLQVGGPDGRELVRVYMTFDQFAAALVSHSHVPCTLASYWSRGKDSVWLTERVRRPPSLAKRMENRLRARFDAKFKWMQECVDQLKASAEAGKPLSKTAQAEMARKLEIAIGHLNGEGTVDFTVGQALEELSGIVEQAAIHLSQTYGLTKDEIQQAPVVGAMLERPGLPAPKPADA